jgi:hypothetical protein
MSSRQRTNKNGLIRSQQRIANRNARVARSQPARRRAAATGRSRRPLKSTRRTVVRSSNGQGRMRTMGTAAPAAVSIKGMRVGMSDVLAHNISWLTGFIYVGNGTLGATDGVYFGDTSKTFTILKNIPIAASDSVLGASYCSDIEKHYARKRIRSQKLTLLPLYPSTSNSMTVIIAPERGPGGTGGAATHTDTTAANLYTNILSMNGAKQVASWEQLDLDLTPYIAGGSGAKQNEFSVDALYAASTELGSNQPNGEGLIPTTFAVSGNNGTSGLRGTVTHAVVISQVVDYIDFLGGQVNPNPESVNIRSQTSIVKPAGYYKQHDEKLPEFQELEDPRHVPSEEEEEFQEYLRFKEYSNKILETKQSHFAGHDFVSIPSTIINNNGSIKLNPDANEFKSGAVTHEITLPRSETFINQVKELISSRTERK